VSGSGVPARNTMTNATVTQIGGPAQTRALTVHYPGGEKPSVMPVGMPIMLLEPGDRSALLPGARVPAVVLACAIFGVDAALRAIADEFARHGFAVAAPDILWRTRPPNGRAVAINFCYGGPFPVLGPAPLVFDAGIGCHPIQMQDYIGELAGVNKPVCLLWGDMDAAALTEVLDGYRAAAARLPNLALAAAARMPNLALHVLPGILHGYMMPGRPAAFDA